MIQNTLVLLIVIAVVLRTIYSVYKTITTKTESACGGCSTCDLKNELKKKGKLVPYTTVLKNNKFNSANTNLQIINEDKN